MSYKAKIQRHFVVAEITRELYHNPAILEICDGDDMLVDVDKLQHFAHDIMIIFGRVLGAACTLPDISDNTSGES